MFLVNKNGDCVIDVNRVDMCLEYDKKTQKEAGEIYDKIMAKCYYYGSTENARKAARSQANDYVRGKKPICRILVNDKIYFGDYDEVQGKIIFEKILDALKNGCSFLDIREVEKEFLNGTISED